MAKRTGDNFIPRRGLQAFDEFYSSQWGERWPALKESLILESEKITLENPFSGWPSTYELDPASQWVVDVLAPEKDQVHLDICAAPGGKALTSVFKVQGEGHWFLADISESRLSRLRRVLKEYLPEDIRKKIKVVKTRGEKWGRGRPKFFDTVLLDAPCSGEQYVLSKKEEMKKWSPSRPKRLAHQQYHLLCSALEATKPGGVIVYSTCSINQKENDGVIEKLVKKKGEKIRVEQISLPHGESTPNGWQIFPDKTPNQGPIYISKLRKVPVSFFPLVN